MAQVATAKRLLSRYGNKLDQVLESFREDSLEMIQIYLTGVEARVPAQKKPETKRNVKPKAPQKINTVVEDQEPELDTESVVFGGVHSCRDEGSRNPIFLPIGQLQAIDKLKGHLVNVSALFDSGAELSFIDSRLADKLQLKVLSDRTLSLQTFGSDHRTTKKCKLVEMTVWDANGDKQDLQLITHSILTKPLRMPPLLEEDMQLIASLGLAKPSYNNGRSIQPQVLLGCDQMWRLWSSNHHPIALPSGFHFIPTRIGSLVTGQLAHPTPVFHLRENNTKGKWDRYWCLEAKVHIVCEYDNPDKEQDKWERYWASENAGTQEFTGSEKDEKDKVGEQVWIRFNQTVERRKDGYYVRLPWKENHDPLPDNKSIAFKRLLQLDIVEEVPKGDSPTGPVIHYIAHQAVLTPHKSTTKNLYNAQWLQIRWVHVGILWYGTCLHSGARSMWYDGFLEAPSCGLLHCARSQPDGSHRPAAHQRSGGQLYSLSRTTYKHGRPTHIIRSTVSHLITPIMLYFPILMFI
ncbi:unnamed protein product [Nippostrongylus brasiliensis]|uniref:DUF1758 domain-containing protein n=1 Tax=Nippostrongylus brasiliensis TaxID=27835 RepID=A0A0N4Y1T3_NIPBR|nr:unnamed protein product [Nippostrongylus brasiliensis]